MTVPFLSRVATAVRTIAAFTAVAFAGRFLVVTVSAATAAEPMATKTSASSASPPPPSAMADAPRPSASAVVASGSVIRTTIVVNVDPPRSEVTIDGARVGRTPYVGDVVCRAGEQVAVRVALDRGATMVFDRPCLPGTIHVEGSR